MTSMQTIAVTLLASLTITGTAQAAINVTYEGEAPGIQNTTTAFSFSSVETFNALAPGKYYSPITQTITDSSNPSTSITMQYTGPNGVQINQADQYGGAGGNTDYAVAFTSDPYTLNLSSTNLSGGINYFGFWLSALDAGNQVLLYGESGQLLLDFKPQDVLNVVTKELNAGEYFGDPNSPFKGYNGGQPYIFLNFYDTTGTFSKVSFEELPNEGGYESDNQTLGHYIGAETGTAVPLTITDRGVPEPSTWAMMLVGLGALGLGMRLRRRDRLAFA